MVVFLINEIAFYDLKKQPFLVGNSTALLFSICEIRSSIATILRRSSFVHC